MKSKQVIVIRKDLGMRKGKMVSQGAHAAMKVLLDRGNISDTTLTMPITEAMKDWMEGSFTKITVSVNSEAELLEIYEKAKSASLPCALITDNGLTEFHGVLTKTAVAIGPAWAHEIDNITQTLPLL